MKKIKSIILFTFTLTVFIVIFCFNASAEWKQLGEISYSTDRDTLVTVIRGDNATVTRDTFGNGHYDDDEDDWDEEDGMLTEAQKDALNYTKTLIIESGVKLEEGSLTPFEQVETIIFPDTITVIPEGVCYYLLNLKTVVLPYGVTEIEQAAFAYCSKLRNINIPSTVKKIGDYAFYLCYMEYIKIPDTVESVGTGNKNTPDCLDKVDVSVCDNTVFFSWYCVEGATDYRIFLRENGKWKKVYDVHVQPNEIYVSQSVAVKPETKYTFAIRPFNSTYGRPTYWAEKYVKVTVTTLMERPYPKVVSSKKGTAKITWDDVSENELGYQVWYSTKSGSGFKKYSNYKANATQATVTGLTSGKTYYFKVRAYNKVKGKYVYGQFSSDRKIKIK